MESADIIKTDFLRGQNANLKEKKCATKNPKKHIKNYVICGNQEEKKCKRGYNA